MPIWSALAALSPFAASLVSNIWSSREASKNREFQERMSSTARQRELADMRKAGINPALAQIGSSGASSPAGAVGQISDMGPSTARSLEIRLLKAQEELLLSQAESASASALESRTRAADISMTAANGRYDEVRARAQLAQMDLKQKKQLFGVVLEQARAEIDSRLSSAEAARARAALDKAAETGALNVQEFEKRLGPMGPAMRLFLDVLRSIRR